MHKRGPRGDISADDILSAADDLVIKLGDASKVSLRMLAGHVGVSANAIYTYFPSLDAVLHELADQRLGRLRAANLLADPCPHCGLRELQNRARDLFATPGTRALMRYQPVLGKESFRLSETVMELCEGATLPARDCHDLIMGWFYGSAMLVDEGWTSGTDTLRGSGEWALDYPLVIGRSDANPEAQFDAILRGIGIECHPTGS